MCVCTLLSVKLILHDTPLFCDKVPSGGEERMKTFPPLIAQDFELKGQGSNTAITDIKISSAGDFLNFQAEKQAKQCVA